MRIDKFLKNSRIIKRRTVAKDACEGGRISINEKVCKPGDNVSVGDMVEIKFGNGNVKIEVLELIENPRKDDADLMFRKID